ncbi:MAG: hypothetical protein QXT99_09855 [Candidatus Nitrosotenuis sp.]
MQIPNKLKFSLIATISALFSLLSVELTLQILNIPKPIKSGWTNCREFDRCNQLQFRGQMIEYSNDDFVIVLLGDSLVAAWALEFDYIPERRLEYYFKQAKKNVKVFTIGTAGYGQDQQYLALKEYFKSYRADLVILYFSAETDINDNMFPTSGANDTPKPTFWLKKGKLEGPTEGWLEEIGPKSKLMLLWQRFSRNTIGVQRNKFWEEHILPPPYQPLIEYKGEVDYSWHKDWEKDFKMPYKGIEYEREGPINKLTPRSQRRQYGIDLTRELFLKIKLLVESRGGHFIILKDERPWELRTSDEDKIYFFKGRYYKTSLKQYKRNIEDLFEGFEYYRIPLIENYNVKEGDTHLNKEAIDLLMKELYIIVSKKYFH